MNVLLISQCSKNALTETRRILDQFAERRGERTWQTPITQLGLDTVRRMLKKTARKNTAVACHWIRGRDHSELLWIVGDANQFSAEGAVPTNTTERDVLRSRDENDWHSAEDISLLAVMASLFHDVGKASRAFQEKLRASTAVADAYRHEWVSLRLFEAFVGKDSDDQWLKRLSELKVSERSWLKTLARDDQTPAPRGPFGTGRLPPLAQVIGWLVVSHHRLPCSPEALNRAEYQYLPQKIVASWCSSRSDASAEDKAKCWTFDKLPFDSVSWCERVRRCAQSMLTRVGLIERARNYLSDPYVIHLARMTLMLADHHYSSLPSSPRYGDQSFPLLANTDRETRQPKQRLDEHLIGVASHARRLMRVLPRLDVLLPRIARHRGFKRRATIEAFRWQDRAFDLATGLQPRARQQGFFGVNMASTGSGKTLANGRILYALADPKRGARFTIALGLRTLTLQTGQVYRERLSLGEDDLAILVGGTEVRELYEATKQREALAIHGSESAADLLPDNSYVHYASALQDGPLQQWLERTRGADKLINAPIVACTIDHLMPASESTRGGHQIAPIMRLVTADLVLDEVDDFDIDDLPALARLVHWAGVFGSKVLLSSATLPPSLVRGLFAAYSEGRRVYQQHRGDSRTVSICCAWFDEFNSFAAEHGEAEGFSASHASFVAQRLDRLREAQVRRVVALQTFEPSDKRRAAICLQLAEELPLWMKRLHEQHHSKDPDSGKRLSVGLVRFANIEPLIEVVRAMYTRDAPLGMCLHLCVYHSRFPLLLRSRIEEFLDTLLRRHSSQASTDPAIRHPVIQEALSRHAEPDHVFVVLASPVAEVGRDHDYDWAVVEPSSMRSIIQLGGRVRRHRSGTISEPNILLLNQNIKSAEGKPIAYHRPGFEATEYPLSSHRLEEVLVPDQLNPLNAGPRIVEREVLQSATNLVDLEHRRLRALLLAEGDGTPASLWWTTRAHLVGQLQTRQKFRHGVDEPTFALLPDEDNEGVCHFYRNDEGQWVGPLGNLLEKVDLTPGQRMHAWTAADYPTALQECAEQQDMTLLGCAKRFGTVQLQPLTEATQGWYFHPLLGFWRRR